MNNILNNNKLKYEQERLNEQRYCEELTKVIKYNIKNNNSDYWKLDNRYYTECDAFENYKNKHKKEAKFVVKFTEISYITVKYDDLHHKMIFTLS